MSVSDSAGRRLPTAPRSGPPGERRGLAETRLVIRRTGVAPAGSTRRPPAASSGRWPRSARSRSTRAVSRCMITASPSTDHDSREWRAQRSIASSDRVRAGIIRYRGMSMRVEQVAAHPVGGEHRHDRRSAGWPPRWDRRWVRLSIDSSQRRGGRAAVVLAGRSAQHLLDRVGAQLLRGSANSRDSGAGGSWRRPRPAPAADHRARRRARRRRRRRRCRSARRR